MGSTSDEMAAYKSDDGSKLKFLCSYGGKILPRPGKNHLSYVYGETRIVAVNRNVTFKELMNQLDNLSGFNAILKYKLPNEDLDVLVSVINDDDLHYMMEEYDKYMVSRCNKESKRSYLRTFLFPQEKVTSYWSPAAWRQTLEERYIDAVNGMRISKSFQSAEMAVDQRCIRKVPSEGMMASYRAESSPHNFIMDSESRTLQRVQSSPNLGYVSPKKPITVYQGRPAFYVQRGDVAMGSPFKYNTLRPAIGVNRSPQSSYQEKGNMMPAQEYKPSLSPGFFIAK